MERVAKVLDRKPERGRAEQSTSESAIRATGRERDEVRERDGGLERAVRSHSYVESRELM